MKCKTFKVIARLLVIPVILSSFNSFSAFDNSNSKEQNTNCVSVSKCKKWIDKKSIIGVSILALLGAVTYKNVHNNAVSNELGNKNCRNGKPNCYATYSYYSPNLPNSISDLLIND